MYERYNIVSEREVADVKTRNGNLFQLFPTDTLAQDEPAPREEAPSNRLN
jgi:hypothetical protein